MANTTGVIKLSGKLGNQVHITGHKYKDYIRKVAAEGSKRDEPAFKEQYSRTILLNGIASDLNAIISHYSGIFKSGDFYQRVHSRFRKQPGKNHFLLLRELIGLEVNPRYSFNNLGSCIAGVQKTKNKITVTVKTLLHPRKVVAKTDSYYYEVILLVWTRNTQQAAHSIQYSEWMNLKGKLCEFDFVFPSPKGITHWLVCLGQHLGIRNEAIETFPSQGIHIYDVGTFDKKEAELLLQKEKQAEEKRKEMSRKKQRGEVVRVKAKVVKGK